MSGCRHEYTLGTNASGSNILQRPVARRRGNVKYIEEEVPMNEDWYMVGIVVDVLCELMLSLYLVDHVNISWSMS